MIDWAQIKQLEEDVGAEDLGEVIALFLSEVDEAVDEMIASPPADGPSMASALHFLKGSAYNLGFRAFGDYCAEGEKSAGEGDISGVSVEKVQALYGASKTKFYEEFADNSNAVLEMA
ncbi:MAG: Hpt domain-containing protein [Pseudomonadota bacterium]